jgi:hypothetical protein|tara:strand:+ start:1367 stop:1600 length:234 start_codon:yes stop_codon:yes gene_type:complete
MDCKVILKACAWLCLLGGCKSTPLLKEQEIITEPMPSIVQPLSTDYSYLGGGLVGLAILCLGYLWFSEYKKADAKGD